MKHRVLAMDLGTTNTGFSLWDEAKRVPDLVALPGISRPHNTFNDAAVNDANTIPSALFDKSILSLVDRMGAWPWIQRRTFLGSTAKVGMAAMEADAMQFQHAYHSGFKRQLLEDCASGNLAQSQAFRTTQTFVRELVASASRALGWRPRELVFGTPVDCYEAYRGALKRMAAAIGMNARFVDEPVAAALGYGTRLTSDESVLVIDFGAGTLDLVAMSFDRQSLSQGQALVQGKWGERLGGNDVDGWITQYVCDQLGLPDPDLSSDHLTNWWMRLVRQECCAIKERLFFSDQVPFSLEVPPNLVRKPNRRDPRTFKISRDDLIGILAANQFYERLENAIEQVVQERGPDAYDYVLMVGGSTLLPDVYLRVEQRFGRARIKAWQPFHAVTLGAAVYGANAMPMQDTIFHDYAIRAWDRTSHEPQHQLIVARGTKYPTAAKHWSGRFVPTCAHGEPESTFKLIICEIGRKMGSQSEVAWDEQGQAHLLRSEKDSLVVALNEQDPVLGLMDPPHWPSEKAPRLEIQFGIDGDRWLIATVRDLKSRALLLDQHPVLQLR